MSADPRRILIVRYSALGDVVLATSILEPLRRRLMAMRINQDIAQDAIKPGDDFLVVADGRARRERFQIGRLEQVLGLGTVAKMSC